MVGLPYPNLFSPELKEKIGRVLGSCVVGQGTELLCGKQGKQPTTLLCGGTGYRAVVW